MIARAQIGLCLALLAGCSLLNKPNEHLLDAGPDAARDGGPDGGLDGGVDGGPIVRETQCANGTDDDMDGLADCRDFDCAGFESCCSTERPPTETKTWGDLTGWTPIPSTMPSTPRLTGGQITNFNTGTNPRALVKDLCTPVATGLEVTADLVPVGGGACPATTCYAALVLSYANDMRDGPDGLLDELAVRVSLASDGEPEVRVTRNHEDLASYKGGIGVGDPIHVVIELGPTLDEDDVPSIATTVTALGADLTPLGGGPLLEQHVLMPQSDLVSDQPACTESAGLFVAVEGVGGEVHVGDVGLTQRECANPGQYRVPSAESAILTSGRMATGVASLGMDPWARGGISQPALVATLSSPGTSRWDVLVDATDEERSQEIGLRDLGFAIGHAYSTGAGWENAWVSRQMSGSGLPRMGDCHPSCVGPASCGESVCTTMGRQGLREPSAYPTTTDTGALFLLNLAYVVENTADRTFSIALHPGVTGSVSTPLTPAMASISPSDVGCHSLREPSLVPAEQSDTGAPSHWWLFFTCEQEGLAPEIRGVLLDTAFERVGAETTVLTGAMFGPVASSGIRSPEVLVEFPSADTAYFRIWATALSGSSKSIVLATAEVSPVGTPPALPEMLTPYPENPVLTLDDMPSCPGDWCELLGLSVARRRDRIDTLRFLVAWHVNSSASGREYQLVPLEQIWK